MGKNEQVPCESSSVSEEPPAWFNLKALRTTGGAGIFKTTGFAVVMRGYDVAGVNISNVWSKKRQEPNLGNLPQYQTNSEPLNLWDSTLVPS